ncbi:AmmeMemoRadiSam system radical SAM enzyme [Sunxiuqinia rutila]|uniref:AmmeMemoRadiSam system radical SAM enzyme n=1 Tax=Sunxiuqinia rutila TaxID=1397841 RepID=UPI003D366D09
MHEALYYTALKNHQVQCHLCPHNCRIKPGAYGDCLVRMNHGGVLLSKVYGKVEAMNLDPVEKKPLYHFFPGHKILSVGTAGCNLRCPFCQNHSLTQGGVTDRQPLHEFSPVELVELAKRTPHNIGLAFTYNEPTVNYEFMLSAAVNAKQEGLHTAMISNGYINPEPLSSLMGMMDAFNIDLKAFNKLFYRMHCQGRLSPVLRTIKQIARSDSHLELTTLVIPGLNDDLQEFEQLCQWIADETGNSTVLHLSRYFPGYRLRLEPTPAKTLFRMYDLAKNVLHHVYLGNLFVGDHGDTFCPHCNNKLIERNAYQVHPSGIDASGNCQHCKTNVIKQHLYEHVDS